MAEPTGLEGIAAAIIGSRDAMEECFVHDSVSAADALLQIASAIDRLTDLLEMHLEGKRHA